MNDFKRHWAEMKKKDEQSDLSIKAFRQFLNQGDYWWKGKNNATGRPLGQRTRQYGDYLYQQDREMFDFYYKEWVANGGKL